MHKTSLILTSSSSVRSGSWLAPYPKGCENRVPQGELGAAKINYSL